MIQKRIFYADRFLTLQENAFTILSSNPALPSAFIIVSIIDLRNALPRIFCALNSFEKLESIYVE